MFGLIKKFLRFFFGLYGWEIYGLESLPKDGAFIIAGNHVSFWDPVLVWAALDRKAHFMAKAELFRVPLLRGLIRLAGGFPVRRGESDRRALQKALELLSRGHIVVMFIPGTRVPEGVEATPKPGVAMLASRAGVPVVPVALAGSRHVVRHRPGEKPQLWFGEPVSIEAPEAVNRHRHYDSVARAIWNRIGSLMEKLRSLADVRHTRKQIRPAGPSE